MQGTTTWQTALDAVQIAGKHFLQQFRKAPVPQTVDNFKKALTAIEIDCRDMLQKHIDPVYGTIPWAADDEFDLATQQAPATQEPYWLCDSMDGAIQYLQHLPGWTINLALIEKGEPVFSVIYDPIADECFYAERKQGAYLNGTAIHVSGKEAAEHMVAVLEYGHQLKTSNNWKKALSTSLLHLTEHFGVVRNYGPHGLQLAYIAAGRIDLFVQQDLDTHNWLAGMLIAHEAGAISLSEAGSPWKWGDASFVLGTPSAISVYFQHQKNSTCISQ